MQILSLDEAARRAGVARRTVEREIELGRGPAIVEMSPRRRGIFDRDLETWLMARRRPAPGESDKSRDRDRTKIAPTLA